MEMVSCNVHLQGSVLALELTESMYMSLLSKMNMTDNKYRTFKVDDKITLVVEKVLYVERVS